MHIKLKSVTDARWTNKEKTHLDCIATFDDGQVVPYTATDQTGDALVQSVWDACQNAKVRIGSYVAPPEPPASEKARREIQRLENLVTFRMIQEAAIDSPNVFDEGSVYAGKTAKQVIASIRSQIDSLRGKL